MLHNAQLIRSGYADFGRKMFLLYQRFEGSSLPLFLTGVFLLGAGLGELAAAQGGGPSGSFSPAGFDPTLIENAVGNLFKLVEGAFGALIMVVSGIGAIVAAAMGAYRAAVGMIVVAVGSFILRSLVSLFFGTGYQDYDAS